MKVKRIVKKKGYHGRRIGGAGNYTVIYHVEIHPSWGEIQKVVGNKGIDGVWNLDGSQFTTAWNMEREDLQLHNVGDIDKSPCVTE